MAQRPDDQFSKASRPSLLNPAQQAEADRNRILRKLDRDVSGLSLLRRRHRSLLLWGMLGLAVVLVAIGFTGHVLRSRSVLPWALPVIQIKADAVALTATIYDVAPPEMALVPKTTLPLNEVTSIDLAPVQLHKLSSVKTTAHVPRSGTSSQETDSDVTLLQALVAHTQGTGVPPK